MHTRTLTIAETNPVNDFDENNKHRSCCWHGVFVLVVLGSELLHVDGLVVMSGKGNSTSRSSRSINSSTTAAKRLFAKPSPIRRRERKPCQRPWMSLLETMLNAMGARGHLAQGVTCLSCLISYAWPPMSANGSRPRTKSSQKTHCRTC